MTYCLTIPRGRLQHGADAVAEAFRVLELRLDCDLSAAHEYLISAIEPTPTDWLIRVHLPKPYLDRLEAQDQQPTYQAFLGIHVPKVLQGPGWLDVSYGNDACARSVLFLDDSQYYGRAVEVWVDFVDPLDPLDREIEHGHRFLVVGYTDYPNQVRLAGEAIGFSDEAELGSQITQVMKALALSTSHHSAAAHGALPGDYINGH